MISPKKSDSLRIAVMAKSFLGAIEWMKECELGKMTSAVRIEDLVDPRSFDVLESLFYP